MKKAVVIGLAFGIAEALLASEGKLEHTSALRHWDITALNRIPRVHRMPMMDTNGVEAVMIESVPWKGKPTRAFAYVAAPASAKTGTTVPGVVLVHGGMSTASADWVSWWRDHGYAAIAADNCGGLPIAEKDGSWRRHDFSGPCGWGRFSTCDEPIQDQWFYHAVAINILAQSYLGSRDGVDPSRIGLVGASWGGLLSCVIASVDSRFKFAVPVFGCGYLDMHRFISWRLGLQGATKEQGDKWLALWDPALFLPDVKCPLLWVDGTNDFHFQLDMVARSAALTKDSAFATIIRLPHSDVGARRLEILAFADYYVRGGSDIVRISNARLEKGVLSAAFSANGRPVVAAKLVWTESSDDKWEDRPYVARDADLFDVVAGLISAHVPQFATVCYLAIETADGLVSSTPSFFPQAKGY